MISATRRWLKRNRTNFAIGFGVLGAGYLAGQYILGKIAETRERANIDRVARENLRRRFQQNQEDCTFTVLALLPTAAENILDAVPVENITHELQQQRAEKLGRTAGTSDPTSSEYSSIAPSAPEEDGKSLASFQTDSFMHTSQMDGSTQDSTTSPKPRKTKAQLWSELKISSITRSFTLIYTLALLTLLTRIQLNLLGRRNYLSSVVSLATPPRNISTISLENHDDDKEENSWGNDFETNRKFLTFSWWLLHKQWRAIMEKVEEAVTEVFGPLNPREDITLERLSGLVVEVRKKVEGATEEERRSHQWLPFILPPREEEGFVLQESGVLVDQRSTPSPPSTSLAGPAPPADNLAQPTLFSQMPSAGNDPLRRLLDESSDLIDSPTAAHILTLLLDTLFSQLTDVAIRTQAFKLSEPSVDPSLRVQELIEGQADNMETDPSQAKAKLATILAVVTRQAHVIGNGVPNTYVQAMEGVREMEAFAAVVYSSNFELESVAQAETAADVAVENEPVVEPAVIAEIRAPASGIVNSTWAVFEGAWSRVTGSG